MLNIFKKRRRIVVSEPHSLGVYYIKYNDYGFLETTLDKRKSIKVRGSVIPGKLLNDIWFLYGISDVWFEN